MPQPDQPVGPVGISDAERNRELERLKEIEIVNAIRNDRLRERPWRRGGANRFWGGLAG